MPEARAASLRRQRRPELPQQVQALLQPKARARILARPQAEERRQWAQPERVQEARRLRVLRRSEAEEPPRQEEPQRREGAPGQQPQADEQ